MVIPIPLDEKKVQRVLVVGIGAMGWNHARVCSEIGVLCGVCDQDEGGANRVAEEFGVPGFCDVDEAIEELCPDGVIIATPTFTHFEIASKAIDAGINLLIEKPISDDISKAIELVDRAGEKGLVLGVGHIERHNPVITEAKRRIGQREWGEVVTVSTRRVSNFPGRIRDVGVILDLGIHDIDNATYLMGSTPTSVFATGGSLHDIDYEDHATLMIKFQNGNTAVIEVNWITPMKVRTVSLTCEQSFVELDYMKQDICVSSSVFADPENPNQFPANLEIERKSVAVMKNEPLKLEILDFLQAISESDKSKVSSPLVDGAQGIMALRVALAALESIETGKVVSIEQP
jgi:UDP-N-acetylglucosamine 3-dehydrogenase